MELIATETKIKIDNIPKTLFSVWARSLWRNRLVSISAPPNDLALL